MISESLIFINFYWCFYSRSYFSETEAGSRRERERERERWQNNLERRLGGPFNNDRFISGLSYEKYSIHYE